ncbi:DNA recombination protein RmuC [Halomonas sp. MCCC 1A11036]|uniref:DNA recombination protein RmuC n=1 Tax=Billgrantia zhangzhouensis TaxID=2733481 RepID=A0ABS9ADG3_9GAMM|nr:DNA recombination protein RmuC [Halomonas zhangzhouensis]MCE8019678.1 DNA recombination protein RmuC [Halomonas zhangzhouensis]
MTDISTLLDSLPIGYAMMLAALLGFMLAFGLVGLLGSRQRKAEREQHAAVQGELRNRLAEREQRLEQLQRELGEVQVREARLATTLEQKQQHFEAQLALLRDSRDQLHQEFENLANEILERKGRAFSELSQQRISGLLQPIQAEMKGFREKVETIHRHDTEQRAGLRAELRHLQVLNREITDQAERLTQALQGQKKVQGNWGELMLENVLEGSGLRPGKDYQREVSFATAEGRRRPDAVVYLPQGRHLVIDAKTSLAAYVRYVNAEDEVERGQALAAHATAVGERIAELADKHYYDLPGLNSPDVVIMFIPVESAYVEALKHDETLYQRAIEHNVLVATPTTLLTSLNVVRQLWRFEDQSRHSAELASRAERFYNKLRLFLESMQEVQAKLDGARDSYDRAMGQLVNGRGNLIKQAAEFQELGVAVKKELPAELVERAGLELETTASTRGQAGADEIA